MNYSLFASESVCAGHPDKICDQISDAILDAALSIDKKSRVALETLVTKNRIVLAGEVTCPKKLNFKKIVRAVIKDLDYTKEIYNFTHHSPIEVNVHQQSSDIALGVDTGGAGDQGMMYGYAVAETPELMPLPIAMAQDLSRRIDEVRKTKLKYLRPDGKTEVAIKYINGLPVGVEALVIAVPHDLKIPKEQVKEEVYQEVVVPCFKKYNQKLISIEKMIFNGTGQWEIGGPATDTGVTGRKIIVDTYGGMGRIGGGAFSGKDPSKVDRSAAYAARFIAKNIVAAGLAHRCEVQLAYAIGHKDPICKSIETFGTAKKSQKVIEDFAWNLLDLSPKGIISGLKLLQPIYRQTAAYGHFGNSKYPWEKIVK
jgi:S-adenosylmethionine synthetase